MRITCSTCGAPYEVDEAQIPPGGLTMKCTQCHASISVGVPAGPGQTDVDAGWDMDLPAPAGARPGAPPSAPRAERYYLRRKTGKVFGPFLEQAIASMLEQGKLEGTEDVSPDNATWYSLSQIPALAPLAAGGGAGAEANLPAPRGAPPGGDLPDLPAPRQAPGDDALADLPAPVGAPQGGGPIVPPPPESVPGAADPLGDLPAPVGAPRGGAPIVPPPPRQAPGDDALADLPAPVGAPRGGAPIVPPPPESVPGAADPLGDLPAPKGASTGGGFDLGDFDQAPADVGELDLDSDPLGDLPAPRQGGGGITDLPAPAGAAPPPPPAPATGMEYGQIDLGDDSADLPQPREGLVDLPQPRAPGAGPGLTDLPQPALGLTDLPRPADGVTGLPEPREGVTDLPRPTGAEYGQLDLGDDQAPAVDDLPVPAGKSVGLELDEDFDLPAPKEGEAGGGEEPDLVAPRPDSSIDVVAPKDSGDADGISTFAPPSADDDDAAELTDMPVVSAPVEPMAREEEEEEEEEAPLERASRFKNKLVIIAAAVVVCLAAGGVTMYLLGGGGEEQAVREAMAKAEKSLRLDTYRAYQRAASAFSKAASKLQDDPEPVALQAQALLAMSIRFGGDKARRSMAKDLIDKVTPKQEDDEDVEIPAQVQKAIGLKSVSYGNVKKSVPTLKAVSDAEPGDAQAALYLGWAHLYAPKPKPKAARQALQRALDQDPAHAAALYGMALLHYRALEYDEALPWLDKTLKASRNHPSALLIKGRILTRQRKLKQAEATLQVLSRAGRNLASRAENALAYAELGHLAVHKGEVDAARKLFDKALKMDKSCVRAMAGWGRVHYTARHYKDARTWLEKAHQTDPRNLEAAVLLARTYNTIGLGGKAAVVLKELRKIHPDAPEILLVLGEVEAAADNYDSAAKHLETLLKRAPENLQAYRQLALVRIKQKQPEAALALLKRAAKQLPGSPEVRNLEGEVLLALNKVDEARTKFSEALKLDKRLNVALFNLASVLLEQGQLEQARKRFEELRSRDTNHPGLGHRMGVLYFKLEDYKKAAQAYAVALKEEQIPAELRLDAADAYNLGGEQDKCLKQTKIAIAQDPTLSRGRAIRARCLLDSGKRDDALVEIRQAVSRDPRPEYQVILGDIQAARGKIEEAVLAYTAALKDNPDLPQVRLRRARLWVQLGTVKQASRDLEQLVKELPKSAEAQVLLGGALSQLGKEKQAIKAYQAALSRQADHPDALYRLGLIYADTPGRKAAAVPVLAKALKGAAAADPPPPWQCDASYSLCLTASQQGQRAVALEACPAAYRCSSSKALKQEVYKILKRLDYKGFKPHD